MIQEVPEFQEGAILRGKTLQTLRDYSYILPELLRKSYSKGIVSGMEITTEEGIISVGTGVFSLKGKLFFIHEPLTTVCQPSPEQMCLKLKFISEKTMKNAQEYKFSLIIEEESSGEDEFELCRFRLQEGAKLRTQYVDFKDISTEYDTINLQYAQFSASETETMHPTVLTMFAKEILKTPNLSPVDQSFSLQILGSSQGLNKIAITSYLELKTQVEKTWTFPEIYTQLLSLLTTAKLGKEAEKPKKSSSRPSIMID